MVRKRNQVQSKPLVWLSDKIKIPPMSADARRKAGFYLRKLQLGYSLSIPVCRPMPQIGKQAFELRITDPEMSGTWRIFFQVRVDCILVLELLKKKTNKTPQQTIEVCRDRIKYFNEAESDEE